jgi:hypothetical protein
MPWYTYDFESARNAQGQLVQAIQEAFYTGAGNVTQLAATNPSNRTLYTRISTQDPVTSVLTQKYYHEFPPGSTRQNSSVSIPAGTITPVQDPDNASSWSILEVVETGMI